MKEQNKDFSVYIKIGKLKKYKCGEPLIKTCLTTRRRVKKIKMYMPKAVQILEFQGILQNF